MRHLKSMARVLPLLTLLWQPESALANRPSAAMITAAPTPSAPTPSAPTTSSAKAPQDKSLDAVLTPGDNLVVAGIPPVPKRLVERVGRYTEFRTAAFLDWHPLRREQLIQTRFGDVPQVHKVVMPGGARTQLTFYPDRIGGASYEPTKGDYFLFSKDVGGGEWFQIFRYDVATGDITMLTDGKSRNLGMVWNQTGTQIAYSSTRRTGKDTDLWVMNPLDKASDRIVLELTGGGWTPLDFSPDGQKLLLQEELSINESYLWLVDLAKKEKTLLTPKGGIEKVSYGRSRFAKDGQGIYLTTDKESEFQRLAYVDLAGQTYTYLTTSIPWDVEEFDLSHDGRTIALATNENGESRVYLLATQSKQLKPLRDLPVGVVSGLSFHRNGAELGFTLSSARASADSYSVNVASGKLSRWTQSESGGLNTSEFAEPKLVKWKSFDGREISGFLYLPPKKFTGRRPVIVNIHGGPEAQFRPGFIGRNNFLLSEMGVAILFPNVRGSSGYGKTFLKLDDGDKREDSYKDAESLYKWLKTRPEIDGERIMVTGGSYGGHMTLVSATHHSGLIRCALAVVGMSSLVTFLENTEGYRRDLRRVEYGDERIPKMREFLNRIAPLNLAKNVQKPLFIVQGQNDPRVPASEAEQMIRTVKQNNVPAWFLLAKDEGHGFAKKKNQDFQFYATVLYIEEFLLK